MQPPRKQPQAPPPYRLPFWLWTGVAVLGVLSLYMGWQAQRLRRDLAQFQRQSAAVLRERAELAKEFADARQSAAILNDPASRQVSLWPQQQKDAPALRAYWHPRLGLVVAGARVPPLAPGHTLQVWLLPQAPGQRPLSAGLLRPQLDGKFVLLLASPPGSLAGTRALAITEEPAGGSPQPTSPPRWAGPLG
ncbi:MAG: anti-sigma factor [Acidobacteriia bacterium]|nr:anti-sigma factor [Terriglobia bacterium]